MVMKLVNREINYEVQEMWNRATDFAELDFFNKTWDTYFRHMWHVLVDDVIERIMESIYEQEI